MLTAPNSFIQVAFDCPVDSSVVPTSAREPAPAHLVAYRLLSTEPYRYTNDELVFELHLHRLRLPEGERTERRSEIWDELFSRPHACMRASPLPKRFGWGVHSDAQGRLALVGVETEAYRDWVRAGERGELLLTRAMRSRRG